MSVGGSRGSSNQTTTNRIELPPELESGLIKLVGDADAFGQQGPTPYGGPLGSTAGVGAIQDAQGGARSAMGYNPTQATAFGGAPVADVAAWQATAYGGQPSAAFTAYNMDAAQVGPMAQANAANINRGGIRDVSGGTGAGFMDAYRNPYEGQVVQQALSDIQRQGDQAGNAARAQAAASGNFGGSRGALLEAETQRNTMDAMARTAGDLRSQGFNTAAALGQQDAGRSLQAGMANQGVDMGVLGQNAGFAQQAALANQAATNQGRLTQAGFTQDARARNMDASNQQALYNADQSNIFSRDYLQAQNSASENNANRGQAAATTNASTANTFARDYLAAQNSASQFNSDLGLRGAGLRLQGAQSLAGFGGAENAIGQINSGAQYGEFQRQQQDPFQRLALRSSIFGGTPYSNQGTQTSRGGQSGKGGGVSLF